VLGEPEPLVRPAQTPLWRRLAVPVGLVSVVLCVSVALAAGPLRNLFGLSPLATPTAATATLPAVSVASETAANTEPPATATVATTVTSVATTAPTAEPTATRTAVPSPTVTEPPTATATEPLPPDVLAVGTVTLAEGIVRRLRDAPNGNVVGGITNGTVVTSSRPQTTADGIIGPIRLPDSGQTGWVGESLLTYTTRRRASRLYRLHPSPTRGRSIELTGPALVLHPLPALFRPLSSNFRHRHFLPFSLSLSFSLALYGLTTSPIASKIRSAVRRPRQQPGDHPS
jgi:hypothetical protein